MMTINPELLTDGELTIYTHWARSSLPSPSIRVLLESLCAEREQVAALRGASNISPDEVGRIMHESWSRTKRAQGFHGRHEACTGKLLLRSTPCYGDLEERAKQYGHEDVTAYPFGAGTGLRCAKFHPDLIPWEELPQGQQDLNLHAFDDVLAEIRRRGQGGVAAPDAPALAEREAETSSEPPSED